MADATQELMLRVRGDNSGVDKAVDGTTKAINRLQISGEKAKAAFGQFTNGLKDATSASDVAGSAANALSNIVSKSLGGAAVVGAAKLLADQIEQVAISLKDAATAAQKAFDDIEKAGQAMDLSEAQSQVASINTQLEITKNKVDEIEKHPFKNFISNVSGATDSLKELVKTEERLRDMILAEGMVTQNNNEERLSGLDDEEKQLEAINQQYKERDKIAANLKDPEAYSAFQGASAEKNARDRNALLDKFAKNRADKEQQYQEELFKAEMAASKFEREAKEKADKEIADQKKADAESAHKEEIYNIEEEAKLEAEKEKTKFDREIRNARRVLEEQKQAKIDADKAAQATMKFGGGLLGASASGKLAMEAAQKQRERQVKQENFKTQEAFFEEQAKAENARRIAKGLSGGLTAGDMKVREAEKVAAAAAPTLAEQAQAQATGMSAEQVAIANVAQRQAVASGMALAPKEQAGDSWKGELSKTMQTMVDTLNKLMSAPLVTSGAGGS
jgi:colicin import membrane protein